MIALNYTQFREHMKEKMDLTVKDSETIIITRKNNENVVVMSEDTYNNLMENKYLLDNPANRDFLEKSKAELENNNVYTINSKDLIP